MMSSGNPVISRLKQRRGRIQGMLSIGGKARPGSVGDSPLSPIRVDFAGKKFQLAAKKMRAINKSKLGSSQTGMLGFFSQRFIHKMQEMQQLVHLTPKVIRDASIWSAVETTLPGGFTPRQEARPEPGVLRQGSVIQKFSTVPKPGQSLESFRDQIQSQPQRVLPTEARRKTLPGAGHRLFSAVEEITPQKGKSGLETLPSSSSSEEKGPKASQGGDTAPSTSPSTIQRQLDHPAATKPVTQHSKPADASQKAPGALPPVAHQVSKSAVQNEPLSPVTPQADASRTDKGLESEETTQETQTGLVQNVSALAKPLPADRQSFERPPLKKAKAVKPGVEKKRALLAQPVKPAAEQRLHAAQPPLHEKGGDAQAAMQKTDLPQRSKEAGPSSQKPRIESEKGQQPQRIVPLPPAMKPEVKSELRTGSSPSMDEPGAESLPSSSAEVEMPLKQHVFARLQSGEKMRSVKPVKMHRVQKPALVHRAERPLLIQKNERGISSQPPHIEHEQTSMDEPPKLQSRPLYAATPQSKGSSRIDPPQTLYETGPTLPLPHMAPGLLAAQQLLKAPTKPLQQQTLERGMRSSLPMPVVAPSVSPEKVQRKAPVDDKPPAMLPSFEEKPVSIGENNAANVVQRKWEEHSDIESQGVASSSEGAEEGDSGIQDLATLAEDVFPYVKRILEIEANRSSGSFR
jgi:hypothetical protein